MVKAAIKASAIVKKRTKKFIRHQSDKYAAVAVCAPSLSSFNWTIVLRVFILMRESSPHSSLIVSFALINDVCLLSLVLIDHYSRAGASPTVSTAVCADASMATS